MKNLVLIVLFLTLGLGCGFFVAPYASALLQGRPNVESGDYATYFHSGGPRVVLFSTSTCPYCKRTRDYLASRHIDYDDNIIDASSAANERFKALNEPGVPVILTEHRKLVGFSPAGLEMLVNAAN